MNIRNFNSVNFCNNTNNQPKQLCWVINRLREMKTARHLNVPEKAQKNDIVGIIDEDYLVK